MKIQEKPDYLIFAESAKKGEVSEFPDVSRGWGITIEQTGSKPPMEWMNGAFNRVDKNTLYLLQQGVPEWCENVTYPANAIIKYNGVLYTATVKNDNAIPTTSDKWKKTNSEIADASLTSKGVVQLNSATDSTIESQAATPKAVHDTFEYVRFTDQKAQSAFDHASNAHNRITDVDNVLSNVTDRLRTPDFESELFSADKRYLFVVRNDGIAGVYNTYKDEFSWFFNSDGWCGGFIEAPRVGGLDQFVRDRTPPVGVPLPWPQVYPPAGWLECNGSTFNKNQFPKLAAAYPHGFLPDLRGEFIRGWDNTRGADPSRAMLSWQAPQISAHRHVGGWGENSTNFGELQRENYAPFGKTGINGVWCGSAGNDFDNALVYTNNGTNGSITTSRGNTYWNDLNPADLVGNETRPRNIAFMYIVKAE